MDDWERAEVHKKRAYEVADTLRKFVIGINTGGIALLIALATSLSEKLDPRWLVLPVVMFALGLTATGISLALAKYRELKRAKSAADGNFPPNFDKALWRSQTWDIASLCFFALGVVSALVQLWMFKLEG